jgi:hypothetical protein
MPFRNSPTKTHLGPIRGRKPNPQAGKTSADKPRELPFPRPSRCSPRSMFPARLSARRSISTGAIPIAGFLSHENVARIMAAAQHTRDFDEEEDVMYVIREVVHCKPGKVRGMVEKFMSISNAMKEMGQEPLRLLTDVTGEPFWTLVAEAKVEKVDDFFAIEEKLMTNETIRKAMADYHDLVESGRREIYRVES